MSFVTPAVAEGALFFTTLVFVLAGQADMRRHLAAMFGTRDAKLRFIRFAKDVEDNLASYVAIVTVINGGIGAVVRWARGCWDCPTR